MAVRRTIAITALIAACNASPNPSQTGAGQARSTQATTTCGSSTPRKPNVLVIADDPQNPAVATLASILAGGGSNVTTTADSGLLESNWTGGAPYAPGNFDVVVHMDRTWGSSLSPDAQSLLDAYVNAGHGFIAFQYDGYELAMGDYPNLGELLPMGFDWSGAYQCMDCDVQASVDPNQVTHPVVAGVSGSGFTFHTETWDAPPVPVDPDASVLVWSNASGASSDTPPAPLVIAKPVGSGRVVNFGLVPGDTMPDGRVPNSLADAPSADLNKLLVNAVAWAANLQTAQVDAPVAVAGNDQQISCVSATAKQTVVLDGGASSGTPPLAYKWTDQNGNVVSTAVKANLQLAAGSHTFSLVVSSSGCESAPSTVHVNIVADQSAPTIDVAGGASQTIECASAWVTPTAIPTDVCSASITNVAGSVDTGKVGGPYSVTYTAEDAAGNQSSTTLTVNVVDTHPPMLTLGASSLPAVECGTPFTPPGIASAFDTCVGAVMPGAVSTVNSQAPGSYSVTYVARDPSGNSTSKSLPVQVVDTTKPVIAVNGAKSVNVECGDSYVDPGATVSDSCDKSVALNTINPVNTKAPSPYVVTYSATDASQNSSTDSRNVVVSDTLPPVLTLNGSSAMTLQCGVDRYVEPGASAVDKCSGPVQPSISGSVNASKVGQYLVSYSATDSVGHATAGTRKVSVVDTFGPSISVKPMLQLAAPPEQTQNFMLSDCASVADACEGAMNIDTTAVIDSIYSDEKGNGQDDINFIGPTSFQLRLKRDPKGNGHVFGVSFHVSDSAGNVSHGLCKIGITDSVSTVAIDDGPSAGYVFTPAMDRIFDKPANGPKPPKEPKKKLAGRGGADDFAE